MSSSDKAPSLYYVRKTIYAATEHAPAM